MGKWTQAAQRVREAMDAAGAWLKGKRYMSLIDGNAYAPDAYPAGWEMK